jgi:tetratricopeptide (TPR) repeat protein
MGTNGKEGALMQTTARRLAVAGFALFLLVLVVGLLTWGSMGRDNDLWTHLSAGRYIVSNGEIPSESFSSYLEPPRAWPDYAWLFQTTAYAFHQGFGSYGLVLLRAVAFILMLGLIFAILEYGRRKQAERKPGFSVLPAMILVFYTLALLPRFTTPRPHIVTLLALVLCLYLLECQPKKMWLLPLVTLVWMNGHGIAYPLMFVTIGAYLAESVVRRIVDRKKWTKQQRTQALWGVVAIATFVLTPLGIRLIPVPFRSLEVISQFILELRSVDPFSLLQWSVGPEGVGTTTAMNVIRAAVVVAVITLAVRRRLRIAHALLVAGAVALMFRGARFEYMALLLAVPVLAEMTAGWDGWVRSRKTVAFAACMITLLGAYSLVFFYRFQDEEVVPYGTHGAPRGVALFLEREGSGGRILNRPDIGGYLNWKLHPRFEITAEMQTPYVFDETDVFHAVKALNNEMLFRRLLTEYHPEYIVAPLGNFPFARYATERTPFVPIFFDEITTLYVNREARPEEAESFMFRTLDLGGNLLNQVTSIQADQIDMATQEIDRMLRVDPDGGLLNLLAATLHLRAGKAEAAETHALTAVKHLRGSYRAHATVGDVYKAQKRWQEAAKAYRQAIERSPNSILLGVGRKLAQCYTQLGKHHRSYDAMKEAVDATSADAGLGDLYELALSARRAGRESEAQQYLRFADLQTPPGDSEWRRRIEAAQRAGSE